MILHVKKIMMNTGLEDESFTSSEIGLAVVTTRQRLKKKQKKTTFICPRHTIHQCRSNQSRWKA